MQVRALSLLLLAGALWVSACTRESPPGPAVAVAPPAQVPSPAIAGDVEEGRRVATRVGCLGCHGKDGSGRKLWGEPDKFQIWSPNITDKRALYDDAGFERLLRAGKTHDGHRALGMPVLMFKYLSDREVRDITAFIRSMPAAANPELQSSTFTAEARREIEGYEDDLAVPPVAAPAEPPLAKLELGKHIAMTSCSECHGPTLDGFEGDSTPPLVVAKAYSKADFERLLRTGVTATGKESQSGLMSEVARDRFATTLSTSELDALKAWLDSR
jgi:mono/diheme cytochrome c family protein